MTNDSKQYFSDLVAQFEEFLFSELKHFLHTGNHPEELYEPMYYALSQGGKRLRPCFAVAASRIFGKEKQCIWFTATALELFHNFTLIHDDVMDHSDMRHGVPSVVAKYGLSAAILSGDAMFALAFHLLTEAKKGLSSEVKSEVMQTFSQMSVAIMEGQQYDINFQSRSDTSLSDYIHMIRLKTAELLATALKMGALIGGATPQAADLLYQSGIQIGLAFQLRDDHLDVYGSTDVFGKPIGGDIAENKQTWLLLSAKEKSAALSDKALEKALTCNNREEKIERVKAIYDQFHLADEIDAEIATYTHQALLLLSEVERISSVDKEALAALKDLYNRLASRAF